MTAGAGGPDRRTLEALVDWSPEAAPILLRLIDPHLDGFEHNGREFRAFVLGVQEAVAEMGRSAAARNALRAEVEQMLAAVRSAEALLAAMDGGVQ